MTTIQDIRATKINSLLADIVKVIRKYLSDEHKVLLFGSWATMEAVPTSDVDIAIAGKDRVDDFIMVKIKEEIEQLPTLRSIDIIDFNRLDKSLQEKILKDSEVIG